VKFDIVGFYGQLSREVTEVKTEQKYRTRYVKTSARVIVAGEIK
jgi:hypothetical protein